MRKTNVLTCLYASLILNLILGAACSSNNKSHDNVDYVDPGIGGVGHLLQPTRPTVQLPNQMIRMYPVRKDYLDDQIRFFPLTLISHRLGELFGIMPFTGTLSSTEPISAWDPQLEISTPYYFSTWLEDFNVKVEFTPGKKVGFFRFTFPDKTAKNVFLKNVNAGDWQLVNDQILSAWESFKGMKAFVFGSFNQKPTLSKEPFEKNINGIFLSWPSGASNIIEFKYAVSFISPEQAQKNFENEILDSSFENLQESAKQAWDKVLN